MTHQPHLPEDNPLTAQLTEKYLDLLDQEDGWTEKVRQFEQQHQEEPGATELFESIHSLHAAGKRARIWKWTTRCAWLLCIVIAGTITVLAFHRGADVQQTKSELQQTQTKMAEVEGELETTTTAKTTAEKELRNAHDTIAKMEKNIRTPETLLAAISIRPDQELGGDKAEVTVDRKGVFRAVDLVKLSVTTPKDGFATLLWLDPQSPQIYPKPPPPSQPEKEWRVTAGEANLFPGPLPKPRGEVIVMVVITPEPSTPQIRKALPLDDKMLLGNADRIQKLLTEQLLRDGRPWVAYCRVTLAPEKGEEKNRGPMP